MDRCRTSGMPSVPSFQERMRLRAAHFTDNDSRGLQSHAGTEAIEHRHASHCSKIEIVLDGTLQFGRILYGDHTVMRSDLPERIQNPVHKSRLAASSRAHHKDV